jgi:hypothetical protein
MHDTHAKVEASQTWSLDHEAAARILESKTNSTDSRAKSWGSALGSEHGARYRVRTCDPYRVKVVLYH